MPFREQMGFIFPNGCRISHGSGAQVKKPFADVDITMHNFSLIKAQAFCGQLGFMEFTSEVRLPRHIHMDLQRQTFIDERILVLHGVGLVEIEGEYFVVAPGSLVDAVGGVPHTWTACPSGVSLPDGTISNGSFTMVYEYEDTTSFFPTRSTQALTKVSDYEQFQGPLDEIRMPKFSAKDVVERAAVVINKEKMKPRLA